MRYPEKYLFDVLGRNVKAYDLEQDPGEQSPDIRDVGKHMSLIRSFFRPKKSGSGSVSESGSMP